MNRYKGWERIFVIGVTIIIAFGDIVEAVRGDP